MFEQMMEAFNNYTRNTDPSKSKSLRVEYQRLASLVRDGSPIDPDDFTIDHNGFEVEVGKGDRGYWFSVTDDNGAHPNSPYYEDYYFEDGPFETLVDAVDEGVGFVNSFEEGA